MKVNLPEDLAGDPEMQFIAEQFGKFFECVSQEQTQTGEQRRLTVFEQALELEALGFWVVPLYAAGELIKSKNEPAKGKEPWGKGWGLERRSKEWLADHFRRFPEHGIGICFGPGRGPGGRWRIDLEGDGDRAAKSLALVLGSDQESLTPSWDSRRGSHTTFVLDESDGLRLLDLLSRSGATESKEPGKAGVWHLDALPDLEWRIGGYKPDGTVKQVQSVVPPTNGEDGVARVWRTRPDTKTADLPPSALEVLEALIEMAEERTAIQSSDGSSSNGNGHVHDPWVITVPSSHGDVEKRAIAYLATCEPAISGEKGHDKTFGVACRFGPGFNLSEETTVRLLLSHYNPRCVPAWTEAEIRHKVADAFQEQKKRGWLLDADDRKGKHKSSPAPTSKCEQARLELDKEIDRQLEGYRPKTFGQIVRAVGELTHLWLNWLIIGNLSLIYSKPKQGKTRIYIRWIKTLWFAEAWADGAANPWPAGTKTLILPYDRNHQEIAADMKRLGIPDDAAVCPHDPRDATGVSLLSITDPLMLAILDRILAADDQIKLLVVDTLTYASEKSLSKPEDMKEILDNIIKLAIRRGVAVLVLIHENRDGEALGRRICERARVLMKLERYSDSDPTRLRLFVKESNFKERPALTVIHRDDGVVFEKDQGQTGNTADRRDACAKWLIDHLWKIGVNIEVDYGRLINSAGEAGFAGTLPDGGRWSNPKLLDRAIRDINEEVEALREFHDFKIERREEMRFNRSKPVVLYRLVCNRPGFNPGDVSPLQV